MPQSLSKVIIHIIFSTKIAKRGWTGTFGRACTNAVLEYVESQEEHHRSRSFQEEYRDFLRKYCVEFDERYVWD
jgi:hypothetical protein